MPVKNGIRFLPDTLASIEAQTYQKFQMLVWDNGSTDGTIGELNRWIPSRLPGRIVTGRPLELGDSLAALVEEANTEFCARIDADDLNHPRRLEKQVIFLQKHPGTVLVGSAPQIIDEEGLPSSEHWEVPTEDAEVRWGSRWLVRTLHGASLFRRSSVLRAGNYRNCKPAEDHDLIVRLSMVGRIENIPEKLFQYRRHASSVTVNTDDLSRYRFQRETAIMNLNVLFPELTPTQAMRVWELGHPKMRVLLSRVTFSDLLLFRRAAAGLARAVGEHPSYFIRTTTFFDQYYHIRHRYLECAGFLPLVGLKQKLAAVLHLTGRQR